MQFDPQLIAAEVRSDDGRWLCLLRRHEFDRSSVVASTTASPLRRRAMTKTTAFSELTTATHEWLAEHPGATSVHHTPSKAASALCKSRHLNSSRQRLKPSCGSFPNRYLTTPNPRDNAQLPIPPTATLQRRMASERGARAAERCIDRRPARGAKGPACARGATIKN